MTDIKPVNKRPQIGVRFPPSEMERIKERAESDYAGNVSTLVKVAVKRLMESAERDQAEQTEQAA